MFSDQQLCVKSPDKGFDEKHKIQSMKHLPSQIILGAMSTSGTTGLLLASRNNDELCANMNYVPVCGKNAKGSGTAYAL